MKLYPGSKFPSTSKSACAYLSDGFFLSLSSLPPSSPFCFSSFPCLFSLSLISPLCFAFVLFSVWSLDLSLLLSLFAFPFCLFLSVCLSSLSLLLYFYFGVSLCVSVSFFSLLSPHLPSLSLSLSTVKKAKFDGAQGKWPLFLPCPVLSVCLCLGEIREGV